MDQIYRPLRKEPDEIALRRQIVRDLVDIKRLAQGLATMADLDRVLAGIPDPETRQQVRSLLVPLVTFPVAESHGDQESDHAADTGDADGIRAVAE